MMNTCSNCRWFDERGEPALDGHGDCKRFPPKYRPVFDPDETDPFGFWPIVFRDDWCGEFKPPRSENDGAT